MAVKERRAREKEILRADILDAARELFVKEGYENVSMRRIAEKIEYSPTTIYLYFRDKAELLQSICEETFAALTRQFEEISKAVSDPVERLRMIGRTYIDFGRKHPNQYRLTFMMGPFQQHLGEVFQYEGSLGQKCFEALRATVEECVKQRKFRNVDVDTASQSMWAAVHGVTSLLIAHPWFPWVDKDKLIDQVLEMAESFRM